MYLLFLHSMSNNFSEFLIISISVGKYEEKDSLFDSIEKEKASYQILTDSLMKYLTEKNKNTTSKYTV